MNKCFGILILLLFALSFTACKTTPPVDQEFAAAASTGDLDTMKKMVEDDKADPSSTDDKGYSSLEYASNKGHLKVVEYLNEKGAKVKYADSKKATALHHAAYMGHYDIVKRLVKKGADVDAQTDKGYTPVERAAYRGHVNVVTYLYEHKADVYKATKSGDTPLHMAAFSGSLDVVEYLSKIEDFNPNVKEKRGYTPMHYAAYKNHFEVVKFLATHGGDVTAASKDGVTVLSLAKMTKNQEMIDLLISLGAE
jgi:cytohesin